MRKLLFLLLFAALAFAYTDRSFQMTLKLLPDGNAHVVEKTFFNLDSEAEKDAFRYTLELGRTTLGDWQKFSKNVRYHITGSTYDPRVVAAREFSMTGDTASITLEYQANNLTTSQKAGSRATRYSLRTDALLLSQNRGGEIVLGNNMEFTLEFPKDATEMTVAPDAGIMWLQNAVKWNGPTAGKWDVSYLREKSMSQEVNEFLFELYDNLRSPTFLIILVAAALLLVFLKVRHSSSK